jgi:glutamate/tyrosine decarboxylase-like PLP-dependent enzyme
MSLFTCQKIIDFTIENQEPISNAALEQLVHLVVKHSNKSNHPHYVTEMFGGYDLYALAGSWIADALNTTQFTYEASPIFTMTDNYVIERFLKQLGWANGDGAFTAGGSMANMYAMVYARNKVFPDLKENGMYGRQTLVVFTSEDSHFSMEKSVALLGLGTKNIVSVKADANGKMRTDELERAIVQAIAEGKKPFFVNSTAGTTVLSAFDDFEAIADICEKYDLWMNVDVS